MSHLNFRTCTPNDLPEIADFLWSIKDELQLPEKSAAAAIVERCFEHGGAYAGYHGDTLIAMLGYFLGEPSQNYSNKEVGFIYVTGIAKPYRLGRAGLRGMDFTFRRLHTMGVKEIRCHASEHDPYTNRLYSHFAEQLGTDTTLSGKPAILYGNTMENILAYLNRHRTRPEVSTKATVHSPMASPEGAMLQASSSMVPVQPDGTLWHCSPCDVWWLSKASASPESWRLERMVEVDLNKTEPPTSGDSKAPAWNVSGPSPLFCPECGKTIFICRTVFTQYQQQKRDQPDDKSKSLCQL